MQITIRLNERGEKEIQKIKEAFGIKKNAPALEFVLLGYSSQSEEVSRLMKKVRELEQEKLELQAVVSYLESK
jgi:Ca2+-binding EF-hand superfamily protein